MAILGRQLKIGEIGMPEKFFPERFLDFLKSEMSQGDETRPSQRHFAISTVAEKGGQRNAAILPRRVLQKTTKPGRHATGDEGVGIAPEIDPGFSVSHDFADEIGIDRTATFPKAFF